MITRKDILNEPSYWVEDLNGKIYDALIRYKETNNLKQKDLAKLLDITPGRVSQILNSGDINFSYEKMVSIILKLGYFPEFKLALQSKKEEYDILMHEVNKRIITQGFKNSKPANINGKLLRKHEKLKRKGYTEKHSYSFVKEPSTTPTLKIA